MPSYRTRGAVDLTGFNAGIDAIAKAFAPPSAHEILYGAQAQKIREDQARIADLYAMAGDPNVNVDVLDRKSIIGNLYDPSNSYHAIRANNAAAGQRNDADNRRALQQTQLQQRGETDRALLAPVGKEQTRFVPPSIASAYDLPPTQVGVVEVGQGQQATLPDGRVIAGAPKPESFDEFRAREAAALTPELRRALAFGNTPTTNVQTAGGPKVMTMLDALGQSPAPDAQKVQLANYRTADGRQGTARFQEGAGWTDTQTGAPLPAGAQTYTAALQGGAADTGLGKPAMNDIESQLVDVANTESTLNQIREIATKDPGSIGLTGSVQGVVQDAGATLREAMNMLSPQLRKMAQDAEGGLIPRDVVDTKFNPNIPAVQLLENMLVAQVAKMNDPNGRLSNQQMDEVRRGLRAGGFLGSAERTLASLAALQGQIDAKRAMLRGIAPQAAAIGAGQRSAPVPAPQAQQPGAPVARRRFNPATGQIE